jgi:hypothetical protein
MAATNNNNEALRLHLETYVTLHDTIAAAKLQLKQLNEDFKTQGMMVEKFLMNHPGNVCKVTEKHTVQLKHRKKIATLNPELIGDGFAAYQLAVHGHKTNESEQEAFLGSLQELRQKKKTESAYVHVLITQ